MALHHVAPGEIVRLTPLREHRGNVRTHALAKTDRFEAICLIVPSEGTIAEHSVSGPITLQCMEGMVEVAREGGSVMLQAGDWIYLGPGERHAVEGIEDASLLLTIIF